MVTQISLIFPSLKLALAVTRSLAIIIPYYKYTSLKSLLPYKDNRHNDNDCPMIQQYFCTICFNWYRSERKRDNRPRINQLISCCFIKMAILTIKCLSPLLENYFIRQMSGRTIEIFTLGLKYREFYTKYGQQSCIMLLL